ncbi:MAG TPA: chemotaxis protein CheW [Acetobacteraceae bacterium]|nr:chemotaxis protein CheW [Acetobacteraceae bacterium]
MDGVPRLDASGQALRFSVAGEEFFLPCAEVAEIIRPRTLTRVPNAPATLLGVLNLRGTVLPVLSLAMMLDLGAAAAGASIIVLDRAAPVGLLVDEVTALGSPGGARRADVHAVLARDFPAAARRGHVSRHATGAGPRGHAPASVTRQDEDVLLGFLLAGQEYALRLDEVAKVIALPAETVLLPRAEAAMPGVVSLNGRLLPLVSLRALLGLPPDIAGSSRARVMVSDIGGASVGLLADAMTAVLRVPASNIDKVPPVLTRGRGEAEIASICRLEGGARLVAVLAPSRLFDSETRRRIATATARETVGMQEREAGESRQQAKFLVFQLGPESYGLPIDAVEEVVRRPNELTRVPQAPGFVEGVMNLRGQVVPIIDQRRRFALPESEHGGGQRIIVVRMEGLRVGFVVDAVSEVRTIAVTALQAAPALACDGSATFDRVATSETGGNVILLVDAKALLDRAEREVLAALDARDVAAA